MLSPQQKSWAREEYLRNGGDMSRVARDLGLNYADLKAFFAPAPAVYRPILGSGATVPKDERGRIVLGREEMRDYIISARHVYYPWPEEHEGRLAAARAAYDAGKMEMCQGRDGPYIIQYAIPRAKPTKPREYFSYRGIEDAA